MKSRALIPVLLGAAILGSPALSAMAARNGEPFHDQASGAAVAKQTEQCTALEKQFDTAITSHMGAAKANEAKAMRTAGGKLCAAGDHKGGIAKLETALNDLGVKPRL